MIIGPYLVSFALTMLGLFLVSYWLSNAKKHVALQTLCASIVLIGIELAATWWLHKPTDEIGPMLTLTVVGFVSGVAGNLTASSLYLSHLEQREKAAIPAKDTPDVQALVSAASASIANKGSVLDTMDMTKQHIDRLTSGDIAQFILAAQQTPAKHIEFANNVFIVV